MKKSLIIFTASLLSLTSYGATKTNSTSLTKNTVSSKDQIGSQKNLVFHFSTANALEYTTDQRGSINANGAFGVGLKFQKIKKDRFGYLMGVHFELPRTIKSFSLGGSKTFLTESDQEKIGFIYADPSLTYAIDKDAYVFGGLNYAYPTAPKFKGISITANIGYQYGIGYKMNNKIMIEAMYRKFKFELDNASATNISQAEMDGYLFQMTYAVE